MKTNKQTLLVIQTDPAKEEASDLYCTKTHISIITCTTQKRCPTFLPWQKVVGNRYNFVYVNFERSRLEYQSFIKIRQMA
jgi:hypothetical protein